MSVCKILCAPDTLAIATMLTLLYTLCFQAQLLLDKAAKAGLKLNTYAYNACMAAYAKAADADGALALLETMQQLSSTTTTTADDDVDATAVGITAASATAVASVAASAAAATEATAVEQTTGTVSSSGTEPVASVARHSLFPPTAKVLGSSNQDPATSPSASDVTPDIITYNLAMDACAKSGDYALALWLLSEVLSPSKPALRADSITWGTAIAACSRGGNPDAALALLQRMRLRGVSPCSQAYASAIGACKRAGRSKDVLALVDQVSQSCVFNIYL
jgi:pentatricopeptide repeat protein